MHTFDSLASTAVDSKQSINSTRRDMFSAENQNDFRRVLFCFE